MLSDSRIRLGDKSSRFVYAYELVPERMGGNQTGSLSFTQQAVNVQSYSIWSDSGVYSDTTLDLLTERLPCLAGFAECCIAIGFMISR